MQFTKLGGCPKTVLYQSSSFRSNLFIILRLERMKIYHSSTTLGAWCTIYSAAVDALYYDFYQNILSTVV